MKKCFKNIFLMLFILQFFTITKVKATPIYHNNTCNLTYKVSEIEKNGINWKDYTKACDGSELFIEWVPSINTTIRDTASSNYVQISGNNIKFKNLSNLTSSGTTIKLHTKYTLKTAATALEPTDYDIFDYDINIKLVNDKKSTSSSSSTTERSCTVSVDVSNYANDAKDSKYFYANILKNCPGSKDSYPYSNPKATVTSNTSSINMNFDYARTNGVFKFNNIETLKNNTSMTVKLTYKDKNGTSQVTNLRFMFVTKTSTTTTTNVCCYNKARGTYYTSTSCYGKDLEPQADRSKCNANQGNTSAEEQVSACYEVSTDNKTWMRKYDKENELLKKFVYVKKVEVADKSSCIRDVNNSLKNDTDKNSSTNTTNNGSGSGTNTSGGTAASTTSGVTGSNVCTSYTIERVRSYNCTGLKACKKLKDNNRNYSNEPYFYSAVSNMDDYYYVYKTHYNCDGFNKSEELTSFCIDPGLQGPKVYSEGSNNYSGTSINQESAFGRGLYRLYSYWYIDKGQEIRSMYQGASPTGGEDFLDYMMDNVARKLRITYDKANSDYIASLQKEWKAYSNNDLGTGISRASDKFKEIWNDVKKYAESDEKQKESSLNFSVDETVNSTKKNRGKGFETEFKVTLSGDNSDIIKQIVDNKSYKIVAKTNDNVDIDSNAIKSTLVTDWNVDTTNNVATATYKVTSDDIYSYVSADTLESIKVGLQITYKDPKSIDNILLLTTTETNGGPKNLQDFVTFQNGDITKFEGVTITFDKTQQNVCKPTYALPCTGPETVVYLIEGTQSGALFNTVMNGIKSVDDLRNVISGANDMVQNLINGNFTNILDKNNLQVISGLLYNFVDKASVVRNIKNELSFLNNLGNNGNKTAAALYKEINESSFSTNSAENFKSLSKIISKTLINVALNGYDKVSSEWQEIVDTAQDNAERKLTSNSVVELLENVGNAITSSQGNLKNIFGGVENLTDYLSKFTNITDIESAVTSFSASIKSVVSDNLSKLSGIKDGLSSMLSQLGNGVTSLSQVSNIFDSITNALIVDWDKCIIGENGVEATDPGGNSYTIQESNDDGSNIFCTVVCKEDYAIKSPGSLGTVYAGRYISTNLDNVYHATLGMAGQRTCATTEIKNDKYVEAATNKKDEMLATYNEFYESYAKYKALKNYEKSTNQTESGTSHPAYTTFDKLNTSEIVDKLQLSLETIVKNSFNTFFTSILGNEGAEQAMYNFADDAVNIVAKLATLALSDDLDADSVKGVVSSYVDEKIDKTVQNLEGAVQNLITSLTSNCKTAATEVLKTAGGNLLSGAGKFIIQAACNHGPGLLDLLFGAGEILRGACLAYSGFSTAVSTTITGINASTGHKIFQIEDGITYSYSYYPYIYENSETLQKKLAANFVEAENVAKNLVTKTATSRGNRTEFWVMKYEGSFQMGSLNYGSMIFRVAKQIHNLTQDIQKFGDLDILESGALENQLNSFVNSVQGLSGGFKLSWLKKNSDSLSTSGFSGLSSMISHVLDIFSDISGATDNVLTGVTDLVDSTLLVYYDFLGIFNPFYSSLADIRREMEEYKEEYNALQAELTDLADRMNGCTEWTNTYQFNPQIEFTYGYSNNNLLDYITNKKSITTDKITLKAINKNEEPEQITYYCQQGVDIKDVQNWDVITSGKCTTDDGIFGSVLSSLLGDDNAMSSILNVFKENSAGLKKILNSSKVKEYISSTGYADKISNFLCSGLGEAFCGIFGDENEDGSLVTLVPGSIVYKLKTSTNSSSSNGIQSWTGLLSAIGGGGSLDSILSGITRNLTYSTGIPNDVKYHDVGRVVSISRYGNPGVSVSGLSWTSILSNIASYVTDKTGIDALDKINDTLMSVTGQGAQQFIYYKSSKPYWTYSNKGIYIINPDVVDPVDAPVLVDNGDPALTDDSIKSGTDAEKQPEGLVYPIALSTAEGKYHYQIKINNVGQYYDNVNNLGRIIDDTGYVSGLYANKYVCNYEVKKEPEHEETCETIIASSDCTSQEEPKTLYFKKYKANYNDKALENQVNTCVTKLLSEGDTCCSYVSKNADIDSLPESSKTLYKKICTKPCQGTRVIGTINDTTDGSSSSSSSALITKTGTLQFYTKVVSNYDLFPNANSSKGYNWSGQTSGYENITDTNKTPSEENLSDIIDEIEKIGDGIYDEDNADKYLEYSITLNGACMSKIKEYNDQKEVLGLGFGDYTAGSISQETRDYTSKFLQEIEENNEYSSCKISNYLNRNK